MSFITLYSRTGFYSTGTVHRKPATRRRTPVIGSLPERPVYNREHKDNRMGDEARQRKRTGIGANGFYTGEPAWGPISLARYDPG